jgi:hypothetical protein
MARVNRLARFIIEMEGMPVLDSLRIATNTGERPCSVNAAA